MVKYKDNPLNFPHLCHTCVHEREHCMKPAINEKGFISLRGEIVMDKKGNIIKCEGYKKK
jgi:hypothetical protein